MKKIFYLIFVVLLLIYGLFSPYSQIFGKVVHTMDTDEKVLYLTFDDGPGEETEEILDILNLYNVKATFFVVGERIYENPETLVRISEEGHSIGVHSMTHPYLYTNNYYELSETKKLIETFIVEDITLFRPPYGFRTPFTIKTANDFNMTTITWSSFPYDNVKTKDDIVDYVISNLDEGQIICLHDGPMNRQETLVALPDIINQARAKGYRFEKLR